MYECCSSRSSHPYCPKQSSWEPPLPDRVLDLEALTEDGDLRLKSNERSDLVGRYIALSHCWGHGPKPLVTTTKNISSHMKRIKFNDLPRSFQDAVRICRRLSVRYLWLDTLCILQDSRSDWAHQASKMASVYEDAFLTLAFSAAPNSEQAILSPRLTLPSVRLGGRLAHVHLRNLNDVNADNQPVMISRRDFKTITQSFAPLGHRAWAYQESLLSPRVLYFTSCQLAWKCREGAFVQSSIQPQKELYSYRPLAFSIHENSVNPLLNWQACVEHFSGLSLSVAGDKLAAFSGIAKRFATLLQDEYIAGMWKSSLPDLLLWWTADLPEDRYVRPLAYRAPSWSWAAIDGRIRHIGFRADSDSHCLGMRLIRVASESATSDVFGAVKAAELQVRGCCGELVQDTSEIQDTVGRGISHLNFVRGSGKIARTVLFCPDIVSEFGPGCLYPPGTNFTFLRITPFSFDDPVTYDIQGLVLKEVDEGSGVFRRVGCLTIYVTKREIDLEEWVERDLVLI